jgi:hypothetical protein
MDIKDKLELFKNKGWTYDDKTGDIFSHTGRKSRGKSNDYIGCGLQYNNKIIKIKAHQLAWYLYYNEVPNIIDHIDRNKQNNKIENLRNITHQQNTFNTNAKGYYLHKPTKKYRAYIRINNNLIGLGGFDTEIEAREAYLNAKKIYHII